MFTGSFELISPFSPDECVARLSAAINVPPDGYDRLWNGSGNARVRGTAHDGSFRLSVLLPGNNTSSYTSLTGTLRSEVKGTMISGQCVFDSALRKVMWGAGACAVFIGIPIVLILMSDFRSAAIGKPSDFFDHDRLKKTMGLVFIASLNAVYPVLRLASRGHSDLTLKVLTRTLQARASHHVP